MPDDTQLIPSYAGPNNHAGAYGSDAGVSGYIAANPDAIWSQRRYDAGWYGCTVVHSGKGDQRRHTLTVTLLGTIPYTLHRESITTSYDRPDEDKWRKRCEQVINYPELRTP